MTMIVINRNQLIQPVFLTLTELTTIPNPQYLVVAKCDATRNVYRFYLPNNISNATERFDLFLIETSVFESYETGYFTYQIYQSNSNSNLDETSLGEAIDYGKMLIRDNMNRADDYIIYDI